MLFQAPAKKSLFYNIIIQLVYGTSRLRFSTCQASLENFTESLMKQEGIL